MRGWKPRLPVARGLRGWKPRLPARNLGNHAYRYRIPYVCKAVGALWKRASSACAVGNRAYRYRASYLRGWKPRLPTSGKRARIGTDAAPTVGVLCKRASSACAVGNRAYRRAENARIRPDAAPAVGALCKRASSARDCKPRLPASGNRLRGCKPRLPAISLTYFLRDVKAKPNPIERRLE